MHNTSDTYGLLVNKNTKRNNYVKEIHNWGLRKQIVLKQINNSSQCRWMLVFQTLITGITVPFFITKNQTQTMNQNQTITQVHKVEHLFRWNCNSITYDWISELSSAVILPKECH